MIGWRPDFGARLCEPQPVARQIQPLRINDPHFVFNRDSTGNCFFGGRPTPKKFDAGSAEGYAAGAFRLASSGIYRQNKPEPHHHE